MLREATACKDEKSKCISDAGLRIELKFTINGEEKAQLTHDFLFTL